MVTTRYRQTRRRCIEDSYHPSVVELFAGAGLFGLCFSTEGFELRRAVEIDAIAAATYRLNLHSDIEVVDVRATKPRESCDVLISGPPCQGFSTLGRRDQDDPRNALCLEVARWAKAAQPKVIVVENVAAFLDSSQWETLYSMLIDLGYEVQPIVLNAVDFGVAQLRLRSFTIASRVGFPIIRRRSMVPETVRRCFAGLPHRATGENHHYAAAPSEIALARMKVIPSGGDKRDVMNRAPHLAAPSWWTTSGEVTDVWGRMEWDAPCNTLRTEFLNPSKGRYIHPQANRVISLREGARLHSIPDSWQFMGTPYQIARQIGNSVPPLLGRALARAIRKLFPKY
ncbi:MAG: DNA cytosine methyltransferase [Chthoniobacterales bacterium]